MGHKGTPRDRQAIADKLQPVEQASSDLHILLIWDGVPGKDSVSVVPESVQDEDLGGDTTSVFQVVSLAEGMTTDDWIMEQLVFLKQSAPFARVQVVTADRALRRRVLETKPIVKGVVNPVVFWRRYRPRLTGLKSDYSNVPKNEE